MSANKEAIARAARERRELARSMTRSIACLTCSATYDGARSDARAARWEPYATRTQHDLDVGPMVCPACIHAALDNTLDAIRRAYASAAALGPYQ